MTLIFYDTVLGSYIHASGMILPCWFLLLKSEDHKKNSVGFKLYSCSAEKGGTEK